MMNEHNLELPLDELDIPVKAFVALSEHGVLTLGDIVSMSQEEICRLLEQDIETTRIVLAEVFAQGFHLTDDQGIYLEEDAPVPSDDETWSAVFVFDEGEDAPHRLAMHVRDIYEQQGSIELPWDDVHELTLSLMPHDKPPIFEDGAIPDLDDVIIVEQEAAGWYAVLSHSLEWTPLHDNPLASMLSMRFEDVVEFASVAGSHVEVTRYIKGVPAGTAVTGSPGQGHALMDAVRVKLPLNLLWFVQRGALEDAVGLYEQCGDLECFGSLTGCEEQGFRKALQERALGTFTPEQFFLFR